MRKYKIKIEYRGSLYCATLLERRYLLFWYAIDYVFNDVAYNKKVVGWIYKYKIPYEKIKIIR